MRLIVHRLQIVARDVHRTTLAHATQHDRRTPRNTTVARHATSAADLTAQSGGSRDRPARPGRSWSTIPTPSAINELYGRAAPSPGHVWFAGISYKANGDEAPAVLSTSNG
ncbi:MAG: hypothetical protein ABSG43_02355 [Solirubrobacteraceae bacterium]